MHNRPYPDAVLRSTRHLVFNSVGALAVAVFGQAHLVGVTERALAALGADPDGEA